MSNQPLASPPVAEPPVLEPRVCGKCGAANYSFARHCFLCRTSLVQPGNVNPYAAPPGPTGSGATEHKWLTNPAQGRAESAFLYLLVVVVVLAIMLGIGLAAQESGTLILYLIVVVPALAAAGMSGLLSVMKGEAPKPSRMLLTMVFSVALTIGVGFLLVLAGIILLFMLCLGLGSPT